MYQVMPANNEEVSKLVDFLSNNNEKRPNVSAKKSKQRKIFLIDYNNYVDMSFTQKYSANKNNTNDYDGDNGFDDYDISSYTNHNSSSGEKPTQSVTQDSNNDQQRNQTNSSHQSSKCFNANDISVAVQGKIRYADISKYIENMTQKDDTMFCLE